jgi:prepilin-type N-terminal cleavage/methylation domain-containing protein
MKFPSSFQRPTQRRHRGFTLIELLVVVAIIAILTAVSVGGFGKVMNMVKSTKSKKMAVELAAAVSMYYNDYDTLPVDNNGGDWTGNTVDDSEFLSILAAKGDVARNSRKNNYIGDMQQAKRGPRGTYEDGIDFETDPVNPTLTDSWGQPYYVIMDSDYNEEIENPIASDSVRTIRGKRCIVYSRGRPGRNGEENSIESEFIKSW